MKVARQVIEVIDPIYVMEGAGVRLRGVLQHKN